MTMRPGTKVVSRRVRVLRDPDPKFVSIVTHGANQTPFSSVKAATHQITGEKQMAIKKRDNKAAKSAETEQPKAGDTGVRKIVFAQKQFADEAAVQAYLDENEWQGYGITAVKGGFLVEAEGASDDNFTDLKEVEMLEGVTATVGKHVSPEATAEETEETETTETGDDAEETETTEKSASTERVIKLDYWDMYESGGETPSQILKDGMSDGVPPGAQEILTATTYAIGNVLGSQEDSATKRTKLASIGAELGALLADTYDLFAAATAQKKVTPNVKKFITGMTSDIDNLVQRAKDIEAEKSETGDDAEETETTDETLQAPAQKTTDTKAPALDTEAIAALIGGAVTKALAPMRKTLDGLTTKVDNAVRVSEAATKAANDAATKVTALATKAPSQKSVPQDEPSQKAQSKVDPETTRKAEASRQNLSSIVGL